MSRFQTAFETALPSLEREFGYDVTYEVSGVGSVVVTAFITSTASHSLGRDGKFDEVRSIMLRISKSDLLINGASVIPARGHIVYITDVDGIQHKYQVGSNDGRPLHSFMSSHARYRIPLTKVA